MLDWRCVQFIGQRLKNRFPAGTVVRLDAHLDQPVRVKGGIGFFFDSVRQAVRADHDDGVQVVRLGAMAFSLGRCELYMSHGAIIVGVGWLSCPVTIGPMKANTKPAAKPVSKTVLKAVSKTGGKVNKAWLHDHINDTYVKLAKKEGYRARAAYKLKEIDESLGLIRPGYLVVDLGSTPGAWSQYARRKMSPTGAAAGELNGRIVALDMLPMEPIEGVVFIQGDFREAEVLALLEETLAAGPDGKQVDVVVSDMAPNLSGIESADAARISDLVELAVDFACQHLKRDGSLVVKLFHGGAYDPMVKLFKDTFKLVKRFKPKASRPGSSETFLVGTGLKLTGGASAKRDSDPD
ncbi:MAG: Ribosomal large subunit methyltransferase [Polaromonas sp.]|jgi:23S rRNA (uridine2552-2'-O)-methyltransferase|nr:Ribosomal large subunit methyltransferase [Polaromonas sp.]